VSDSTRPDDPAGADVTNVDSNEPVHPRPPTPAAPRGPKKSNSDLPGRLLTAAVLVRIVSYVIAQGGLVFLGTVMAIIFLGQREFYRLIEDKGARPLHTFGLAAGAALPLVAYLGTEVHMTVLMTATLLAVMVAQLGKAEITEALASISGTFFGVFYVGWLMSYVVVLRNFYSAAAAHAGGAGHGTVTAGHEPHPGPAPHTVRRPPAGAHTPGYGAHPASPRAGGAAAYRSGAHRGPAAPAAVRAGGHDR